MDDSAESKSVASQSVSSVRRDTAHGVAERGKRAVTAARVHHELVLPSTTCSRTFAPVAVSRARRLNCKACYSLDCDYPGRSVDTFGPADSCRAAGVTCRWGTDRPVAGLVWVSESRCPCAAWGKGWQHTSTGVYRGIGEHTPASSGDVWGRIYIIKGRYSWWWRGRRIVAVPVRRAADLVRTRAPPSPPGRGAEIRVI